MTETVNKTGLRNLLNRYWVNDNTQTERNKAESLVLQHSFFVWEIDTEKVKNCNCYYSQICEIRLTVVIMKEYHSYQLYRRLEKQYCVMFLLIFVYL
jgi:hypothetical protein